MSATTIDLKIRTIAEKELAEKINAAARPLRGALKIIGTTNQVTIKTLGKQEVEVYDSDVINLFIDAAIERQKEAYCDKAINAFVRKVDSLQDQVDDLYGSIE